MAPDGARAAPAGPGTVFAGGAAAKLGRLRDELVPLAGRYDVVVANPPYMGSKNMNGWLSGWVKDNYLDVKGDLFSCFMVRNVALGAEHAQLGFMTPYVWMFIGTYEKLRRFVIEENTITSLIQLEYSGFAGATVPICTFTLQKGFIDGYKGGYIRLADFPGADNQAPRVLEAFADPGCGWFYRRDAEAFGAIPGSPIAYWASDALVANFDKGVSVDSMSDYTGSQHITADNDHYLRYWWEVSASNIGKFSTWAPYSKGGDFCRWFGNLDYVVRIDEESIEYYKRNPTSNCLPEKYWFAEGITYSDITSGRQHFRYYPPIGLFDKKGPVICELQERIHPVLALLNSTVSQKYFDFLNPTLTLQVKDVKSLPVLEQIFTPTISSLGYKAVSLSIKDWSIRETAFEFTRSFFANCGRAGAE